MPRKAKTYNPAAGYKGPRGETNNQQENVPGWGAPPPPADFINGEMIEANKGRIELTITAVPRFVHVTGGKFGDKDKFFFDVTYKGTPYVLDATLGSRKHQILWERFGNDVVGKQITVRLARPSDKTRETFIIE